MGPENVNFNMVLGTADAGLVWVSGFEAQIQCIASKEILERDCITNFLLTFFGI